MSVLCSIFVFIIDRKFGVRCDSICYWNWFFIGGYSGSVGEMRLCILVMFCELVVNLLRLVFFSFLCGSNLFVFVICNDKFFLGSVFMVFYV